MRGWVVFSASADVQSAKSHLETQGWDEGKYRKELERF